MNDHIDYMLQPIKIGDYVIAALASGGDHTIKVYEIVGFTYVRYNVQGQPDGKRVVNVELHRLDTKRKQKSIRRADEVLRLDKALLTYKTLLTNQSE